MIANSLIYQSQGLGDRTLSHPTPLSHHLANNQEAVSYCIELANALCHEPM